MLLDVRISSYGCSWEVWRALKLLELLLGAPLATLSHLSWSPNFPRASTSMNKFLIFACLGVGNPGGRYFRTFWVGMCRCDPVTLSLNQS